MLRSDKTAGRKALAAHLPRIEIRHEQLPNAKSVTDFEALLPFAQNVC
jgi:hypothetical protein